MGYYLLLLVVNAMSFALGLLVGRRGRRTAIAGFVMLLALLLCKAVLNHNPVWEFALFPWPDYIYFQSYLMFPLALGCLGLAAALLPQERNRRAVWVLAGFLFAVSMWTERWIVVEPDTSSAEVATMDRHCIQSTAYSCGPAACVSLLAHWGVAATEGEMMGLCRTPAYGGTSLFRICRGLRLRLGEGYDVRIVDGDLDSLRAGGVPAIVSVHKVHVVTLRFDGDELVVLDPAAVGPERIDLEESRHRYGGPAVIVTAR